MSYFQIAIDTNEVDEKLLSDCIKDIEAAGVAITSTESFAQDDLCGFNVSILDVEEEVEAGWVEKIDQVASRLNEKIFVRYRFKGWKY